MVSGRAKASIWSDSHIRTVVLPQEVCGLCLGDAKYLKLHSCLRSRGGWGGSGTKS